MTLRNRHSKEIWDVEQGKLRKVTQSFSQLFKRNIERRKEFDAILKNVMTHLDAKLQPEQIKLIQRIFENNKETTHAIFEEMIRIREQGFIKKMPAAPERFAYDPNENFLLLTFKEMIGAKFPIVGALAVGALANVPAAAAMKNYVCSEGIPAGKSSICPDSLEYGCIQGYLSDGNNLLTQFNRVVNQVVTKDADFASREQLRKCMTSEKVCNLVKKLYDQGQSSVTLPASGEDAVWNGYQLTSKVTDLPADTVNFYDTVFKAEASDCHSILGQAKQTGIIIGCVVGGVAALACAFGAYLYCKEKACSSENVSGHRNSESVFSNRV